MKTRIKFSVVCECNACGEPLQGGGANTLAGLPNVQTPHPDADRVWYLRPGGKRRREATVLERRAVAHGKVLLFVRKIYRHEWIPFEWTSNGPKSAKKATA